MLRGVYMRNSKGFTLMELMVVVFIIAILVAAAVPSYLDNLRRTRYNEGLVALQKIAQANRTFVAQYPNHALAGQVSNSGTNNPGKCNPEGDTTTAVLYRCGYLIKDNWDALAFNIFVCNPTAPNGGGIGCCQTGTYAAMKFQNTNTNNPDYCGLIDLKMELCEPNGDPDKKNATQCNS